MQRTLKNDDGKATRCISTATRELRELFRSTTKHLRRCKDESHQQAAMEINADSNKSSARTWALMLPCVVLIVLPCKTRAWPASLSENGWM